VAVIFKNDLFKFQKVLLFFAEMFSMEMRQDDELEGIRVHDGFRKLFTEPGELEPKERADGLEKVGPRGVRT
jgi:hypothetical protein